MNWLFQAIPKRFDLAKDMREGESDTWIVTRYMDEISSNDIIFFWMAGSLDVRGLYGWGIATSTPKYRSNWGFGVDVLYRRKFPERIPASDVQSLRGFEDYVLFKMPVGTNFRLNDTQSSALNGLIAQRFGSEFAP